MDHAESLREECQSTVRFETPFWVLVLERWSGGRYGTVRRILGTSEPGTAEIRQALDAVDFLRLSWAEESCREHRRTLSPKRQLREIAQATDPSPFRHTYTRSHELLKEDQLAKKVERKGRRREAEREHREDVRQKRRAQRKERHRGR